MKPRTSPIADRVRAHIANTPKMSQRKLSELAGLNPTQLGMVLARLDEGADIGHGTLEAIAKACGRSVAWLVSGEENPEGVRLRELPGWEGAVAQARARHELSDEAIAAVGAWRVPQPPQFLDGIFVAALARAWADAQRG